MGVYDSQIALAKKLIDKYGQPANLVVLAETPGANAWNAPSVAEVLHPCTAVFLNYKQVRYATQLITPGTDIHEGDQRILIAASSLGLIPNIKNLLRRGPGDDWQIIALDQLAPNGDQILYTLQGRK